MASIGRRVSQARLDKRLTQGKLGHALGMDRTAVVRIESGARRVSATELVALASILDRPVDWFVAESPPSVVSRRADTSVGGRSVVLDRWIEQLARDVSFLVDQGVLADLSERPTLDLPSDLSGSEALAGEARGLMGVPGGPLIDLQRASERVAWVPQLM